MSDIIGKRLKMLRKELKLSQKNFSNYLGINLKTLQNWEQGLGRPSLDNLMLLADKTNVTLDWLVGRSDSKSNDESQTKVRRLFNLLFKTMKELKHVIEERNN